MPTFAAIPYYHLPVFDLGPIPVDPWATLVCIGFVVGMEVARARAIRLGLQVRDVVDSAVVTVGMGFLVGHLVHVLGYHPEQLAEQGVMALIRVWAGFSSIGGFLGAVLGVILFFRVIRKRPFWPHADLLMYGFPFGWFFGRLGCAVVHDHIGRPTDFFLAVDFEPMRAGMGVRHELGLYEAVWTLVIAVVFYVVGRRPRPAGLFTVLWCFLYAPIRFLLDFLRSVDLPQSDARYLGLTPGQYGSLVMLAAGVVLLVRLRRQGSPAEVAQEAGPAA